MGGLWLRQEQLLGESTPSWSNRKGQGRGADMRISWEFHGDFMGISWGYSSVYCVYIYIIIVIFIVMGDGFDYN
jgi:hypothetical protein